MRVVVGLGNPGSEYRKTRHNVGFLVIDLLAERWAVKLSRRAFRSLIGEAQWRSEKVLLIQPQTYMNLSGQAVAQVFNFYRLETENLIVVHDDLDLPIGKLRIKSEGGGAGGNRGIESIIESLGTKDFIRLKIGIGRPPGRQDPANYVLQPFTPREEAFILPAVDRAASAIEMIFSEGVDKAVASVHAFESAIRN